jgi:hypothetical protein
VERAEFGWTRLSPIKVRVLTARLAPDLSKKITVRFAAKIACHFRGENQGPNQVYHILINFLSDVYVTLV